MDMKKNFRQLLTKNETQFIMEAHDGLSAKIVESTGFQGIWASGLSIATALGVRDSNELSWTQVLDVLTYMRDASSLPILVDGDTGYGNFNNCRIFVKNLARIGIDAVCIEDKHFPKTNSFIGEMQPLASIAEFCGKIKAIKDHQPYPDFTLIARVEALIAGRSMQEALDRASAYLEAGADGILIHSKKANCDEIFTFNQLWNHRAPVIIVPTTYYQTPVQLFKDAKISMVIWANHNIRAAMNAMRSTCDQIFKTQSVASIENKIASVKEIFALMAYEELKLAEDKYLPVNV